MRYVESRCEQDERDRAYRIYVTEGVRVVAGLNVKYTDLLNKGTYSNESPDEIISNISDHLDRIGKEE